MKSLDLYKKSLIQLNNELLISLREQFNLKIQLKTGKLKKTHLLKLVRRKIALIKTLMSKKNKDIK